MAYVVTGNCDSCRFTDCVEVCPVNCFYGDGNMLYINPNECIDCDACVPACPVEAIFSLDDVPANQKQSAVMAALAIAQDEKGWLSSEVIEDVAVYLDMAPIAVFEVASFYGMYNLKAPAKFKLAICTCLLKIVSL